MASPTAVAVPRRNTVSTSAPTSLPANGYDPNSNRSRSKTVSGRNPPPSTDQSIFRNLPGSSWFCCKFWKRKHSPPALSASNDSSGPHNATESRQRRPRRHSFYKNLIKRSRTVENMGRRNQTDPDEQQGLISGEFAANTEEELHRLLAVISRLLEKLNDQPEDIPAFGDEECVTCTTSRASMQTFPCGHKVLCKMCFVRTIEIALQERQLPLRCVVCRSRVVRLKQQAAPNPVVILQQRDPPGSYFVPQTPSPLPPSGIRRPGYM